MVYLALGLCRRNSVLIKYFDKIDFHSGKKKNANITLLYTAAKPGTQRFFFLSLPSIGIQLCTRQTIVYRSTIDLPMTNSWNYFPSCCCRLFVLSLYATHVICSGSPLYLFLLFINIRFTCSCFRSLARFGCLVPLMLWITWIFISISILVMNYDL